jgi:TorA maturation chaperone TorD
MSAADRDDEHMTDSQPGRGPAIDSIDQARGDQYRFIASLMAAAPSEAMLRGVSALAGDAPAFGSAISVLAETAARSDVADVQQEFFDLFIGVGRGELLPYASFYLTGFLNERPLAEVRADLARMGIARAEGRFEPEDHIALLFEVMADLAQGRIAASAQQQQDFFARHIAPWAGQFFDDLAIAPSARFYRPVAEIGRLMVDIEARAFSLAA